jgi:hypothetical protein
MLTAVNALKTLAAITVMLHTTSRQRRTRGLDMMSTDRFRVPSVSFDDGACMVSRYSNAIAKPADAVAAQIPRWWREPCDRPCRYGGAV